MAALLALLSSLLWGGADFLGGTATRRRPALAVVGGSQLAGLLLVVVAVLVTQAWNDPGGYVLPGVVAGAVGMVALSAFYAGLAVGRMGVVAAISALGLLVPVVVGFARGDRPGALQVVGMALGAAGAVCASGPELRGGVGARPLLLALLAAAGFGTVLVALAEGGEHSVPMTLLVMRATTVGLLGAVAVARRSVGGIGSPDVGVLAAIGVSDVVANGCYAAATTTGLLSVVAVLGSLYPAVTVVLARIVHKERLTGIQTVGVVAALTGVSLIASGGGVS